MHICKFFCLILVHSNTFQAFDRVVAIVFKYKVLYSYNFVLNQSPNNNDVAWVANVMLNEASNSNDATCVGNNVCLTAMSAQQFSMTAI